MYISVFICIYIYIFIDHTLSVWDMGQMIRVSACPFSVGLQRSSTLVFQIVKYLQSRRWTEARPTHKLGQKGVGRPEISSHFFFGVNFL